ncbi:BspA family leucine-rich repeat surface protein, partial [Enterococcus faecalis]|nr:BspA family leucine-rich repeat surface protein [Enterococcus faecalis]
MKVSKYVLISSLVLGSLIQPVTALAEEQRETLSNQNELDKVSSAFLQTQESSFPVLSPEKLSSSSDSTTESETTTSDDLSKDTFSEDTSENKIHESSEGRATQEESETIQEEQTFEWNGLTLTLSTDGTLSIPEGSVTDPTPLVNLVSGVKKIVIEGPLKVTGSAISIFASLSLLQTIEGLDKLDTSNVTNMGNMFSNCYNLNSLDLSNFNTSNVTNMDYMFTMCNNLNSLDLSNFNTSNVTSMLLMFAGCVNLNSLDLSNFSTSNVTSMSRMFDRCDNLSSLSLGKSFYIKPDILLPDVKATTEYTGKWQNIGTGTRENPNGNNIWSSQELTENYLGERDADTYVWQPYPTVNNVTVNYVDEEGKTLN